MTKEELERIKVAYYSGLKVQIWFNGNWENFDAREYSMYKDPFSENRQYRIVGSDYADMAEKRIAELEKENAELKADNDARKFAMAMSEKVEKQLREENSELKDDNKVMADNYSKMEQKFYDNLTKAKEIIKTFLGFAEAFGYSPSMDKFITEAEQFIKDSEVKK